MELVALTTERAGPAVVLTGADPLRDLFDAHYGAMVRLAALLLGNPAAAEDVVQDAFVAIDKHLARIEPAAHYAYLRKAVVNRARSTTRWHLALKRQVVVADPPIVDPESDAVGNDRRRRVIAELARLSERQRQCLVLRYYAGMTDQEIADHCQIAVGSVKNHLQRGRQALQLTLGDLR